MTLTRFHLGIETLFVSSLSDNGYLEIKIVFPSRNRDAFSFKLTIEACGLRANGCFNLVIEMLFLSSHPKSCGAWCIGHGFNLGITFPSRNRDAFCFKSPDDFIYVLPSEMFPSRNRDAFCFKQWRVETDLTAYVPMFPSRNRDAFCFKSPTHPTMTQPISCFHLGIETLFVSRTSHRTPYHTCVNGMRFCERGVLL